MTENFCLSCITQPLLDWYRENKRILPWREGVTPYRVWVSEIMLQQTRVEAVKEYYVRFLKELPTVEALADCEEGKLMKLWEGLGYYSRVRNMQKAARVLVRDYGGRFPDTEREIRALPGIGDYTAGAVLSIAYGKPVPAIDGNVLPGAVESPRKSDRDFGFILSRVFARRAEKGISEGRRRLFGLYAELNGAGRADLYAPFPEMRGMSVAGALRGGEARLSGEVSRFAEKEGKALGKSIRVRHRNGVGHRRQAPRRRGIEGYERVPFAHRGGRDAARRDFGELGCLLVPNRQKQKLYACFHAYPLGYDVAFYVRAEKSPFPAYSEEALEKEVSLPTAFRQCAEIRYLLA